MSHGPRRALSARGGRRAPARPSRPASEPARRARSARGGRKAPSAATATFAGAVLAAGLAACGTPAGESAPAELSAAGADHVTYGVTRRFSRNGVEEALLRADSMYMWDDSSRVRLMGLTLEVVGEGGSRRAVITAERGRMDMAGEELVASGNAALSIPSEGREISSAELRFVLAGSRERRIETDSTVTMREGGCTVQGDGLRSDLAFDELRILGAREGQCPGQ